MTEGEGVSEEETMKGRTSEKEVEKSKSLKENKGLGFFIFDVRFGKRTSHNGQWFRRKEDEEVAHLKKNITPPLLQMET